MVDEAGVTFNVGGTNLKNSEAFAVDGALPLFAYYAESLTTDSLGENSKLKAGVKIEAEEAGLYGAVVRMDSAVPESVQVLLIGNAIIEYANSQIHDATIGNFDELKAYADKVKAAKNPEADDADIFTIPLDALAAIASAKINPDESVKAILGQGRFNYGR